MTGCNDQRKSSSASEEAPSNAQTFPFTEDNYPRVDGSTATIPLIEAVESLLLDKPRSEISVTVSKTSGAYLALAENRADVLLVYDGGAEVRAELDADKQFETVPIGKDALVFLVNRDNPISNISTEQVQKIFTGEYTNWKEVGGSDEPIRAYQRGIGSGSQALMDKLVMRGLPMGDPATVQVIESMGGLIDAVVDYAGGSEGIGYNVFYYVTEMRSNDYIKILSIDGVEPTYDTIQSGQYPYVSEFFSVIRKSEPHNSPARALHRWMLSNEAQNLMANEHYVALNTSAQTSEHEKSRNFSLYPDGEAPVYLPGVNPYKLKARDDYGELYFYLGSLQGEEWYILKLYGLCTAEGKIVTEPIFTVPLLFTDSSGNKAYFCYRADVNPVSIMVQGGGGAYELNVYPALLFATDGSWIKEYETAMPYEGLSGPINTFMNAECLAVMLGGKWGAVNLKGETVVPFDNDDYRGIYPKPDNGRGMLAVTSNRFMCDTYSEDGIQFFGLYDGEANLIASDLRGRPRGMCGEFIVTTEWSDSSFAVYTYTLDGELLTSRVWAENNTRGCDAEAFGDYVAVYVGADLYICDKQLNVLHTFVNQYNAEYDYYIRIYKVGPNVIFNTDAHELFHRTYLPDGTRLVTWYDFSAND